MLVTSIFSFSQNVLYPFNERCFNRFKAAVYKIPKGQILDSSKLKEFADDDFKFDENGRKSSKQVENAVGKGEIARYERSLLSPQCLYKTCTADT